MKQRTSLNHNMVGVSSFDGVTTKKHLAAPSTPHIKGKQIELKWHTTD